MPEAIPCPKFVLGLVLGGVWRGLERPWVGLGGPRSISIEMLVRWALRWPSWPLHFGAPNQQSFVAPTSGNMHVLYKCVGPFLNCVWNGLGNMLA